MKFRYLTGLVAACMMGTAAAGAPTASVLTDATYSRSSEFSFISAINGEEYRVEVMVPRRKSPAAGYPVLYVLDGDALFGTFAEAMRNRSGAGEVESAIVVGISGTDGPKGASRTYDFSFSDLTKHEKAIVKDLGANPPHGGADLFQRVLLDEIKPKIAAMAPVDQGRSALLGWSLGGHFVVHSMFEQPDGFGTYIALSPALWRSGRILFKGVSGFKSRIEGGGTKPHLFMAVGSREQEAIPGLLAGEMTHAELVAELRYGRMVDNVRDLQAALRPIFATHGMSLYAQVYVGDTHNSMPWSAVNPVLDFAFPNPTLGRRGPVTKSHKRASNAAINRRWASPTEY